MNAPIEFLFDFGSPNAYFVYRVLPTIEARIGKAFVLRPVLLGGIFKATKNRSPVEAYADVPAKLNYEYLEMQRFVARNGIDRYRHNPFFPVNTLALMRGAYAARKLGVFEPYLDAVFAAMWERQLNMADPAVLEQVLEDEGLPAQELLAESLSPEIKQQLIDATNEAVGRGVFGIPTFFVGDEMFFGKDRLRDVEEEYLNQSRVV